MKTSGKQITKSFYKDENGFSALESRWKELVHADRTNKNEQKNLYRAGEGWKAYEIKRLTAIDHLLYAMLRGKDFTRGFAMLDHRAINAALASILYAWADFKKLRQHLELYSEILDIEGVVNFVKGANLPVSIDYEGKFNFRNPQGNAFKNIKSTDSYRSTVDVQEAA